MLKHAIHLNKFKNRNLEDDFHEEYQYLNLVDDILKYGNEEKGRNGITKCAIGSAMHFSLENNKIPILTTKKTAWKTCLKELLWFIKGQTDNKILNDQKVHIWDGNTSRDFLDKNNLPHFREGREIGPMYGFNWRFWGAEYEKCETDYTGKGIDQLQNIIDCLKDPEKRSSRRMVISAWNTSVIEKGVLPPCHVLFQFNVIDGNKLSCCLYQRSVDTILGLCFNIASYSFLTHLIAKHCGLQAYEFIHYGGNCHIYENAIEASKMQINRDPFPFPTISIKQVRENINDYTIQDFELHDYKHHDSIKVAMVA